MGFLYLTPNTDKALQRHAQAREEASRAVASAEAEEIAAALRDAGGELVSDQTVTVLVALDGRSGAISCTATNKDAVEHMVSFPGAASGFWGHQFVQIRHDQDHSLVAMARTLQERRNHETHLELAPVASHQSMGAIERANEGLRVSAGR
jgi:hypothetical protein